jgi:hypothetical protein
MLAALDYLSESVCLRGDLLGLFMKEVCHTARFYAINLCVIGMLLQRCPQEIYEEFEAEGFVRISAKMAEDVHFKDLQRKVDNAEKRLKGNNLFYYIANPAAERHEQPPLPLFSKRKVNLNFTQTEADYFGILNGRFPPDFFDE